MKIPTCLLKILHYVRGMVFEEAPNYAYLNELIAGI